jgi:inositol 1,4,5-triphosphate receptor type 1/inositol 1,4,5-triphosphate receptor type 3
MMRGAGEAVCTSIHECILDLYVSGRIGGSMRKFHLLRFITDLIFFIFFGLLFENIVSGIMIDTFV